LNPHQSFQVGCDYPRRCSKLEDIARAALFLASDEAEMILFLTLVGVCALNGNLTLE
jgi:hypothetical protein